MPAIADGRIGTSGGVVLRPDGEPRVFAAGLYSGDGAHTTLVPCPLWHRLWTHDAAIDAAWRRHPLSSKGSGGDGRGTRTPEPVYQCEQDRALALDRHRAGGCVACVGADPGGFDR